MHFYHPMVAELPQVGRLRRATFGLQAGFVSTLVEDQTSCVPFSELVFTLVIRRLVILTQWHLLAKFFPLSTSLVHLYIFLVSSAVPSTRSLPNWSWSNKTRGKRLSWLCTGVLVLYFVWVKDHIFLTLGMLDTARSHLNIRQFLPCHAMWAAFTRIANNPSL